MREKDEIEVCGTNCIHEDKIAAVLSTIPDDDTLIEVAELFKIFGDSTRVRILYALFEEEVCVCDLAKLLGMTQSAISHQLRILKSAKLIKNRREGKTVFYSLADEHVRGLLMLATEHIME